MFFKGLFKTLKNSPGLRPIGVLDLKYRSYSIIVLIPPPTPSRRASVPRMSIVNACRGPLGGPFFYHFFASILSSILDSFWFHFGVVLGSFWWSLGDPNRAKFDPKPIFFVDRFWLLFWVHLGSDLGPILCPFGRSIRPKFNPKSSLNRLAYENRSPTACCDFVGFSELLIRFKIALSGS